MGDDIVTTSQSNSTFELRRTVVTWLVRSTASDFKESRLQCCFGRNTSWKINGCDRSRGHTCVSLADTWREKQRKSVDCKIQEDHECLASWRQMCGLGLG